MMLLFLAFALTLITATAAVLTYFTRDHGQHSGAGTAALNVRDLARRIAEEHRRDTETASYGRHALRPA